MRKIIITFVSFFFLFLTLPKTAKAISDPLAVPNNRFGIHITDENDLPGAAALVNSTGGDWGYVTIVIPKTDRNHEKWQKNFDQIRRLHLIPLVRIATQLDGSNWKKPNFDEIESWANFLNSLNWVIKNRYVIVANEPNHAKEWGGEVSPKEYAKYLSEFSRKLKITSEDFFVLPAGLDASAPDVSRRIIRPKTMDEATFLKEMLSFDPNVFDNVDGWVSHSYPNPGFSGSEKDADRGSIKTYEWELSLLKTLGVNKNFPVFITETGWINNGKNQAIGEKLSYTYQNIWNNENLVAITPFILNYPAPPFDQFSWKDAQGNFYDFYYQIQRLNKVAGKPIQETKGEILGHVFAKIQLADFDSGGIIVLKNTGQSIWTPNDLRVVINGDLTAEITKASFVGLEPQAIGFVFFRINLPQSTILTQNTLEVYYQNQKIGHTVSYRLILLNPLNVQFQAIFDRIRAFVGP